MEQSKDILENVIIIASVAAVAISLIASIARGIIGYFTRLAREKREVEYSKEKEAVSSPETVLKATREIANQTVQRWFRESQYSGEEQDKAYLAQNLDLLSHFTIEDIMSSDDLRHWLFDVLELANQKKAI